MIDPLIPNLLPALLNVFVKIEPQQFFVTTFDLVTVVVTGGGTRLLRDHVGRGQDPGGSPYREDSEDSEDSEDRENLHREWL